MIRRLRRWWLLVALLLLCAGVALLGIISARRGPLWDKYQQVKKGMTEEEVKALLGPPTDEMHWTSASSYYWSEGEQGIGVRIGLGLRPDGASWDFVVVEKWFKSNSVLERLRELFPE